MDPETVIEQIQENAVSEVQQAVAANDAIIVENVSEVSEALEEHAEASEARHEEILEDLQWQESLLENLTTLYQTQLSAIQSAITERLAEMQARMENLMSEIQNLQSLTGTNQSTQENQPPEAPPVVPAEPEPNQSDAVDRPVPEMVPVKRFRKI